VDTQWLQAFEAVAACNSFSAAADRLHLSQPAVSKRVAALESRLGQALFDRIGRRVQLTEAGRTLVPHARRILAEIADSRRALASLSDEIGGRLSLGLSHHVGLHRMPPVLRRYTAAHPGVELDIEFLDSEGACDAVLRGRLDLAVITLAEPAVPGLDQTVIWRDPLAIFVAADHPLAATGAPAPDQLAAYPALLPETNTTTYRIVADALAAYGLEPQLRLASNNLETLKMLTNVGLGWSVLPETMGDRGLARIQPPGMVLTRTLGVVRHPRRSLSNAARAMLGMIDEVAER